jgi:hypothetical protein
MRKPAWCWLWAHHQLGHPNEARAALAKGVTIVETKLPRFECGEIGVYWVDWIAVQVLMREAKALVEGGTAMSNGLR